MAITRPRSLDPTQSFSVNTLTANTITATTLTINGTAIALGGSAIVGTKTMGLIPISASITWVSPVIEGRHKNSSIWYEDNLKIFKQVVPKSWNEPIEEIKKYLT